MVEVKYESCFVRLSYVQPWWCRISIQYANKPRFALNYDLGGKAMVLPHEMMMEM